MSVPLNPPPPNCTDDPFHCVGRFTWKRIGGAFGSTGAIAPTTLQYSGAAGTTARKEGSGLNGSAAKVSGVGCLSSADSMVAPPLGRPMSAVGIDSFSRVHVSPAGSAARHSAGKTVNIPASTSRQRRHMASSPIEFAGCFLRLGWTIDQRMELGSADQKTGIGNQKSESGARNDAAPEFRLPIFRFPRSDVRLLRSGPQWCQK